MKEIPDEKTCITLLEQVGCSTNVIAHCKAISILAVKIAHKTNADVDLVRAGAFLHDIGRSQSHGIDHAVKGAMIAKDLGLPEQIQPALAPGNQIQVQGQQHQGHPPGKDHRGPDQREDIYP